jgi:vanillate O-demethylase monooxygenase subunit
MENIMAPPFWRMALRGNGLADDVPVDRWQICRFTPPSHVLIEVGVAHAGKGGYHAPAHKASSIVVDFITPETDTSIWYFWGMARNFARRTSADRQHPRRPGQDFQRRPGDARTPATEPAGPPERNLLKLNIDAGGVQSRGAGAHHRQERAPRRKRGERSSHEPNDQVGFRNDEAQGFAA